MKKIIILTSILLISNLIFSQIAGNIEFYSLHYYERSMVNAPHYGNSDLEVSIGLRKKNWGIFTGMSYINRFFIKNGNSFITYDYRIPVYLENFSLKKNKTGISAGLGYCLSIPDKLISTDNNVNIEKSIRQGIILKMNFITQINTKFYFYFGIKTVTDLYSTSGIYFNEVGLTAGFSGLLTGKR